jgi:hypothetical protein
MIPTKVIIGPYTYQVIEKEGLEVNGAPAFGSCDSDNLTIYLDASTPEDKKRETLLHEVLHAIDDAAGIGLTEDQVKALGVWLTLLRLQNQPV